MEKANIDILCIQESKIPSNSCFSDKDYICISSTDIKGGEKPPAKTMKTIISENIPPLEIRTAEQTPEALTERMSIIRNSKQRENESNASYLLRKVLEKSENVDTAESYFEVLLKMQINPIVLGASSPKMK